jgi:hypothetical protein
MEIAISASSSALPRIKKLATILRSFGPSQHPLVVFCTPKYQTEVARIFEGLSAKVLPVLTGIVRLPPMTDNEPFAAIAQHMTRTHWFYLTAETIPLQADWADKLEQEYLASGQTYLGCADYIPTRYRDGSGIDRVVNGAPYILEAAVYPANLGKLSNYSPLSRTVHHEVARRSEMAPCSHLSSLVGNAKWDESYRLAHVGSAVVVARVLGTELGDEVLGLQVPAAPAPPPAIVEETPVVPEPLKEPTMKTYSSMEEMKASQKIQDEVIVEPRRAGRPRKA